MSANGASEAFSRSLSLSLSLSPLSHFLCCHAFDIFEQQPGCGVQVAARAQRASVEPAEVVRYEQYDQKHGAQYAASSTLSAMDEDEW